MTIRKYVNISLVLTLAGVSFAGYLSAVKLFSGNCAFGEDCPLFFGYPACYFGFVIFAIMLVGTLAAFLGRTTAKWPVRHNTAFAALGVLFSGYFVGTEILTWMTHGFRATFFGLSTCAYGLAFYVAILVFSLIAWSKLSDGSTEAPIGAASGAAKSPSEPSKPPPAGSTEQG